MDLYTYEAEFAKGYGVCKNSLHFRQKSFLFWYNKAGTGVKILVIQTPEHFNDTPC
jgi:hypothetical protein